MFILCKQANSIILVQIVPNVGHVTVSASHRTFQIH